VGPHLQDAPAKRVRNEFRSRARRPARISRRIRRRSGGFGARGARHGGKRRPVRQLGAQVLALVPLFATACCGIELMQAGASRYDMDRFGAVFRATPRQSDLMLVAGTITHKMADRVKRLYEQMPEPKYVIAMGSCANTGGRVLQGFVLRCEGRGPADPRRRLHPGCPPRPEALIDGIMKLQKIIMQKKNFGAKA